MNCTQIYCVMQYDRTYKLFVNI